MSEPSYSDHLMKDIVEFPELKFPPIEYGVTEAALAELAERYKEPDASTDDGYAHCKDGCKELTSLRTAVETRRKDLKAPALNWGSKVDQLAKALVRSIKLIEGPVRDEKERIDEVKQAEARKAAEAEQKRVAEIHENIAKIAATAREQHPDDTAADYQQHIAWLTELAITEEVFGELVDDAKTERDAALFKLSQWHEQAVKREADDERRKNEQAELDRKKKELDKIEAKQKKEAARIAKGIQEAAELKATTEKAAKEKADREDREKSEAEKKRVDNIKAAIEIKRTIPDRSQGMSSEALDRLIVAEKACQPAEADFAEFTDEAVIAWKKSIEILEAMGKNARRLEEQTRHDEEARLPDRDKLLRWCDAIAAIPEPEVLNDKAQKILRRYSGDLSKFVDRLRSDIGKL